MSRLWSRFTPRPCRHERILQYESVGVRRSVCDACGHVSFEMQAKPQPTQRTPERPKLSRAS